MSHSEHWFDNVMNDGLFINAPHIVLTENNWIEEEKIALSIFWVLQEDNNCSLYSNTFQGYTNNEYIQLLKETNFNNIALKGNFGEKLKPESNYQVIIGTKF